MNANEWFDWLATACDHWETQISKRTNDPPFCPGDYVCKETCRVTYKDGLGLERNMLKQKRKSFRHPTHWTSTKKARRLWINGSVHCLVKSLLVRLKLQRSTKQFLICGFVSLSVCTLKSWRMVPRARWSSSVLGATREILRNAGRRIGNYACLIAWRKKAAWSGMVWYGLVVFDVSTRIVSRWSRWEGAAIWSVRNSFKSQITFASCPDEQIRHILFL